MKLRKAIRRFYLMYSLSTNFTDVASVLNQVFGANYSDYETMITSKQPKLMLRKIQKHSLSSVVYEKYWLFA